jgi:hypothetical protein
MTNPYGISLDREWTEWAANIGVSPTVAASLLLICQARPLDEIVARLTPRELEQVAEIVGRCPDHFPPGTLDALKRRSPTSSHEPPSASVSTDQAPSRLAARASAESPHRHRPNARKRAGRPFEHPGRPTARARVKAARAAQRDDVADQLNLRPAHRPKSVYNGVSNVHTSERPSGNSRAAFLRRLRKYRPDIHARVLAGEISSYAGMVEAGFRWRSRP